MTTQTLQKVDHAALKANQLTIIVLSIIAFILNLPPLAAFVGLVMGIGSLLKRRDVFQFDGIVIWISPRAIRNELYQFVFLEIGDKGLLRSRHQPGLGPGRRYRLHIRICGCCDLRGDEICHQHHSVASNAFLKCSITGVPLPSGQVMAMTSKRAAVSSRSCRLR